jgi:hypothetical protein
MSIPIMHIMPFMPFAHESMTLVESPSEEEKPPHFVKAALAQPYSVQPATSETPSANGTTYTGTMYAIMIMPSEMAVIMTTFFLCGCIQVKIA